MMLPPPCLTICRAAACPRWNMPVRLTAMRRSQVWPSRSRKLSRWLIPADSSTISSRPNWRTTAAIALSIAPRSHTSSAEAAALPPAARIRAAVASAAAPSRSVQNTAAPSRAKDRLRRRRCRLPLPQPTPLFPRPAPCRPPAMPSSLVTSFLGSASARQTRDIKIVHAGGVATGDLGLFLLRHPGQDLRQDLLRLRKGRLAVRIVRAPHHVVDADDVAQAHADRVLLKAQHDVAAEEVARQHPVFEPVDRLAVPLAICVIHRDDHIRRP